MLFLADIGGTKTRLGLSKNFKKIDEIKIFETSKNYQDFLNLIKENTQNLKIKKACFGFAGLFDKRKIKLLKAPNLKDFENKNLKKDLEKILNCEVILENDALLAGLGEANFGAGKDIEVFGYLTLSTGIGGAKIVNKKADENIFGFEPGHSYFLVNLKNFQFFEVEELISGSAIEKIYHQKPEEIKSKIFWQEIEKLLAGFLVNVSLFWSVDKIILGGGLSKSLNFKRLNENVNKLNPLPVKIKIFKSKLKDLAVLYGCISIYRH